MSLYAPYKQVGFVTDGSSFCLNQLGDERFLTVTIGNSFQVFRVDKLTVCLVSKEAPGKISSLAVSGHETYCAVDNTIIVYNRNRIVNKYEQHQAVILGLYIIGKTLLSYDTENNLKVYDIKERKIVSSLKLLQKATITALVHPATYVNKFVIGYSNGALELWNINSKKIVYTFESHLEYIKQKNMYLMDEEDDNDQGKTIMSITCLEQSPACDVIAIGFSTGDVVLLNLKLDKVLLSFKQDFGAVSSISFRTDSASQRFPFMVTGSMDGRLCIWNLGVAPSDDDNDDAEVRLERKLEYILEEAHDGAVSTVTFLYGEPIMISSSVDNSIKVWIFDAPDGTARLLKSRDGHSGYPLKLRYYGGITNISMRDNTDASSCEMISAGSDGTVRLFNTALESHNREFSQKPILKKLGLLKRNQKLPTVIGFDYCETRQRDWGNMVTIHKNHSNAYLWKYKNRVITEVILKQASWNNNEMMYVPDKRNFSTAVAMSVCGNSVVVGSQGGVIYKYNAQSGLPRGAYPKKFTEATLKEGNKKIRSKMVGNVIHTAQSAVQPDKKSSDKTVEAEVIVGHSSEVTGLFIDGLNSTMISCGMDGFVIFWDFDSHSELARVDVGTPLLQLVGFKDSGFVAVADQSNVIRMFDISTKRVSRRFTGHSRTITDMAFTPDGRRFLSASLDSTVRIWDIPTGRCLSWHSFSHPITSMCVSLSGEYLCISQLGKVGIYMYVDRSLYETVHFWREPSVPTPLQDSVTAIEATDTDTAQEAEEGDNDDTSDAIEKIEVIPSQAQVEVSGKREDMDQRGAGVITMSAIPKAYWTTLYHLEAIKIRNKAKAAPVLPPKAPFFLPTVVKTGSTPSFPTPAEYNQLIEQSSKKRTTDDEPVPDDVAKAKNTKKSKTSKPVADEEKVLAELAAMGSVWDDDDDDNDDNDSSFNEVDSKAQGNVSSRILAPSTLSEDVDDKYENFNQNMKSSRIIKRKTSIARCKLVAYLLAEYPLGTPVTSNVNSNLSHFVSVDEHKNDGEIMTYLKSLPPPAVDVEIRSLCTHDEDAEGIELLRCLLAWLTKELETGNNFEILQAYLHRTIKIYSEMFIKSSQVYQDIHALKEAQHVSCERFRHLIHSNLCLLKLFSGLPT